MVYLGNHLSFAIDREPRDPRYNEPWHQCALGLCTGSELIRYQELGFLAHACRDHEPSAGAKECNMVLDKNREELAYGSKDRKVLLVATVGYKVQKLVEIVFNQDQSLDCYGY